jgi:hypothetical protein
MLEGKVNRKQRTLTLKRSQFNRDDVNRFIKHMESGNIWHFSGYSGRKMFFYCSDLEWDRLKEALKLLNEKLNNVYEMKEIKLSED